MSWGMCIVLCPNRGGFEDKEGSDKCESPADPDLVRNLVSDCSWPRRQLQNVRAYK